MWLSKKRFLVIYDITFCFWIANHSKKR
jgi:hypothetical protein